MRILHTSDWHLGKRLYGRERMDAQRRMGEELIRITRLESVGLVLVSGDVFDTATPSSDAENLFYDIATELGQTATVVVVSGNHDDPARLTAAKQLARKNRIILVGDYGEPVRSDAVIGSGDGWLRLRINGETANLVLLPYPTDARTGDVVREHETYADRVKARLFAAAEQAFSVPGVNLVVSHLFCQGGVKSGSERDIELGTARIVPLDCIPPCDYAALGHIHRPMKLSDSVWYSGSPMPFVFGEDVENSVNLFDTATGVRRIKLPAFDRLRSCEAYSYDEAERLLCEDEEALTQLVLHTDKPLLSAESRALRAHGNLVRLLLDVAKTERVRAQARADKSPEEIFTEYCLACGTEPKRELIDLFLSLVGEV